VLAATSVVWFSLSGTAQQASLAAAAPADVGSSVRELQDQLHQLRTLVEQMRAENAESRAEMKQLRQDLTATRALLERSAPPNSEAVAKAAPATESNATSGASDATAQGSKSLAERVEKLEESSSLMGSKIDEQYQTKVETASKYRARLHGIILMNAFRDVGGANSVDFPDMSQPVDPGSPLAAIGATLRQSEIGLEVFGPTVAGAKTSADIQMDFAGGFPATGNGVNFGIARLQTASVRLDWEHTSLVAGQDSLFISPLSPTSFASLATPTFGYAGNLWAWTPQLRVEHRFAVSDQQTVTLQAGVLDNLDWEYPADPFYRYPQAGEQSGQAAYALRGAWSHPINEHPLTFGVAGYYGRQDWNWGRTVDAWAGMADWQIPFGSWLSLSGEFYRGRGVGGLGGAVGRSIIYGGNPNYSTAPIRGLDSIGGWTQLKFQVTPKIELNGVFAQDNAYDSDVRGFAIDADNFSPILGRNRGALANIVFRPRSDLLLSAELRRLRTFPVYSESSSTNQVNLAVGILF
jgi:prefoldin subunit 5